jgi:hypothetical protein
VSPTAHSTELIAERDVSLRVPPELGWDAQLFGV